MVEQEAVNFEVASSSLAPGAKATNVGTAGNGGSFIVASVIRFEPSPLWPEGLSRRNQDRFP